MKLQLGKYWDARAQWERLIITVLAVGLGIALYFLLAQTANQAREQLGSAVLALEGQQTLLEQHAAEVERLRATPAPLASQADFGTLVQGQIDAAGLSSSLVRIDAQDVNQVQVVFGAASFGAWMTWVKNLQSQHVRLDSCRIEAMSTPGVISATATFTRAKSK